MAVTTGTSPDTGRWAADPRLPHVVALDGLRGVAVAGVLLFHSGLLSGGFLGVDLFFVLSGFLITSLLLAERTGTGGIRLGSFWARRARRLLPALFAVLAVVLAVAALVAEPAQLARLRGEAVAAALYVSNWYGVAQQEGYWDLFADPSPLEHMWSLAIEEQFYLVWPPVTLGVFALVERRRRGSDAGDRARALLVVSVLGALASAALLVVLAGPGYVERAYLGTDTRAAAVLCGAALACWFAWRGTPQTSGGRAAVDMAGVAGALFLAWAWVVAEGGSAWLYDGGLAACQVAVVAVIASAVGSGRGPLCWGLEQRPLVWLGVISYGLYLWHWPVYLVLDEARTGLDGWALFAVRAVASIAVAVVSYLVVEQPIRTRRVSGPSLRRLSLVAVGVIVVGLVGVSAGARHDEAAEETLGRLRATFETMPEPGDDGRARILVAGDSVAHDLGERLVATQDDHGVLAANAALPGCLYADGEVVLPDGSPVDIDGWLACDTLWGEAVDAMDPEVVFFTVADPGATTRAIDGEQRSPCDPRYRADVVEVVSEAVDALAARGARVVIGTSARGVPPYRYGVDPAQTACFNEALASVADDDPRVDVVDVDAFVCPDGECVLEVDGEVLRPDGVHARGEPADLVLDWLVPQLVAARDET